jgi:hypothetical protein
MRGVRTTPLAAALVAAALAGLFPSTVASAQNTAPAPQNTAPAPQNEVSTLQQQRDDLTAQLTQVDRDLAQATTDRDQAQDRLTSVTQRLPQNEAEQQATAAARVLPLRAREQLAVEVYVKGDPRGRQYLDSLATGEFTLDPLRDTVLFSSAEQHTADTLRQLDAKEASLKDEHERLGRDRDTALHSEADAEARITDLTGRKASLSQQLEQVERVLKRAQANANGDPLSGTPLTQHRPALAVKIDNHPDARPQSGLNQADIVYEELVEGGITRFVAIFHSTDADPVGPVRSGRTSDLHILTNLNRPLFGSSGGNDGVLSDLRQANLSSVIENDAPSAYYRDNSRDAPHNLYTRTAALYAANRGDAGEPPHVFSFLGAGEPQTAGQPSHGVTVRVGNDRVDWTWTGAGWQRTVNGVAEADAAGVAIQPTNVIVQFTSYGVSSADANSPEAEVVGSGPVWVFSGGRMVQGTWSRPTPESVTQYLDTAGTEIQLSPGRTWNTLPPPGRATPLG